MLLVDEGGESELQQFEACLTLCNLATVPELRDRIVKEKGWRALEMAMTSQNELVQRSALETMSNLVANEEIAEKFANPTSTATRVFVGFAGSDDVRTQIAATGTPHAPPNRAGAVPRTLPAPAPPSDALRFAVSGGAV